MNLAVFIYGFSWAVMYILMGYRGVLGIYLLCMNKTNHPISSNSHPSATVKKSNIQPHNRGGGLQNQQEHHIILTKYEAVHPTAVSEINSSSGMLII